MSLFERDLSVWVLLCIVAGIVLATLLPGLFAALAALEYASVNLVVAVLIWAMVYPMMVAVDLGALKGVGQRPKGRHHRGRELADQAFHHGRPWRPVLQPCLCGPDRPRRLPPGPLVKEEGQLIIDDRGN